MHRMGCGECPERELDGALSHGRLLAIMKKAMRLEWSGAIPLF